jgi:hypothetical protein
VAVRERRKRIQFDIECYGLISIDGLVILCYGVPYEECCCPIYMKQDHMNSEALSVYSVML